MGTAASSQGRTHIGLTGAQGFLGTAFAKDLARLAADPGDVAIRALDRSSERLNEPAGLADFIRSSDVIVHLAGKNRGPNPELMAANVEMTWHLARAIASAAPSVPLVFSSSLHVYGTASTGHSEEDRPRPQTIYGLSKWLAEQCISNFCASYCILRFANIYGPGARPYYNSAIATFLDLVSKRRPLTIHGDGLELRDYLYVDDAVRALWEAVKLVRARPGGYVFDVATGRPVTVRAVVDALRHVADPDLKYECECESDAPTQGRNASLYATARRFREATGWRPVHTLHSGLSTTWEQLRAQGPITEGAADVHTDDHSPPRP